MFLCWNNYHICVKMIELTHVFPMFVQGELQMTREEKKLAEQRLWELETRHQEKQEQLRLEAEKQAKVSSHNLLANLPTISSPNAGD